MYSRQDVRINTKITNKMTVTELVQPICAFADQHGVSFELGYNGDNCLVATYSAEGKTSAYCKGMIAEIKQMLKDSFHCKIDVTFYAY